jgi:hypothetical protein
MSRISTTEMMIIVISRSADTRAVAGRARGRLELVELPEYLDRLAPQFAVGGTVVGVGELAHPVVELRVPDLAVLRLLRRLERLAAPLVGRLGLCRPQQGPGHDERDTEAEHDDRERVLHSRRVYGRGAAG